MGGTTRRNAVMVLAAAFALAGVGAVPAAAAATLSPTPISVVPNRVYTPTGITVHAGDTVTVTASGTIHFGGGNIAQMTPAGIPWGKKCQAIAKGQARTKRWPASGISCWSLIAKIGAGAPRAVGTGSTFRSTGSGPLFLGVNDNYVRDNNGRWSASVTVTPAGSAPAKKSSGPAIVVLAGVALLAVVVALLLRRRAAARRRRAAGISAALVRRAQPPDVDPLPVTPLVVPVAAAPPKTDSIDVNIYDVEFNNGLTLRVGYNHFPEGTSLRWRVTQNHVPAAAGTFVTKGGGSTNHVETVALGVKLEGRDSQPDGADVQFDWTINGVPFHYSVRRDPNC